MKLRILAALVVVAAAHLQAQTPAQPPVVFRSGVDLVRFDLSVTDASGRPLNDVRAEEIEIVEDGEARPILLFQHIEEPAGVRVVEAARRTVTAEVSSNRGAPRGHLYILVFDQLHIAPGNELKARMAAQEFLRRRVRPSDRVALYALPGPGPQIGFTADRERIAAALARIRGSLERTVASPLGTLRVHEAFQIVHGDDRAITEALARLNAETGDVAAARRATLTGTGGRGGFVEDPSIARRLIQENARTIVAQADGAARQFLRRLADLIAGYRGIEGRKTVVLFSEGFYQENLPVEVEQVAAAAAQSYCVVYALDLNRRLGEQLEQTPLGEGQQAEIQNRLEPLGSLAAETDGELIVDASSRVDAALDALADQSQSYYLVAFAPSAKALESRGAYRRVTVRVTRPGARVSARTGYAVPPEITPADRRRAIDAALHAPFVQQGLRVDYTTYVVRSDIQGLQRVVLSLTAELPVAAGGSQRAADVVFVARDVRDGRVVASGTDVIPLPDHRRPGGSTGLGTFRVQFDVPKGTYLMRAVVREPGGLVGSADRRLAVRTLSGPDVTVSDLVLGNAGSLPVRTQAYVEDGLAGALEAYGRSRDQVDDLVVRIELTPAGADGPVASLMAEVLEPVGKDGGVVRRARFALPLQGIAPGDYLARAIVRAGGETVGDLVRQVEVLEGSAAPAATPAAGPPAMPDPREILAGDLGRRYRLAVRRQASSVAATHAARGLDLFGQSKFAEAIVELQSSLALDPESALGFFFLGWAHEAAGDRRQAISAWRNAALKDPTLVPAHLALAEAYVRLSEPALAVQALKAGLVALPGSPELRDRLEALERRR
jgi:VWFA-related protein